jgi:mannosyltransferase OCH1-like enzyme
MILMGPTFGNLREENYGIPRKIWQTYRSKDLPLGALEARDSWIQENPDYEYHFLDDDEIENYILTNWDSDTYRFFKSFPIGVMKADLWRYLIVTEQGGVYTDIDSICCLPIDYWTTYLGSINKIESEKPLLFIGMENEYSFCQWTFMATPKHPAMEYACKYIVNRWLTCPPPPKTLFVHGTTGPTIWKRAIMSYLGEDEPEKTSIIWIKYNSDAIYRKRINDLGVYFVSPQFYNGFSLIHLNWSAHLLDGYVSWLEERRLYLEKNGGI